MEDGDNGSCGFCCAASNLRHYQMTGIFITHTGDLKNALFWLRGDNTKKLW